MSVNSIVITGASGFLGRNLLERMREDGCYTVYALTSRPEELAACCDSASMRFLDRGVIETEAAGEMLSDALVYHCAFPRNSTGSGMAEGLRYTQRVFEAASKNGAKGLVNISSQSVYSQQRDEAATEKTPLCLETPYAVGKYASELLSESVCAGIIPYTNIRMASLIGVGFEQRIVNRLVRTALETGRITVEDNGQRFGFLDVADAAAGLHCLAASDPVLWRSVYNLGNGAAYSLPEIAETIRRVFQEEGRGLIDVRIVSGIKSGSSALDAVSFRESFCFAPTVTLRESVRRILKGYTEG